MSLTVSPTFTAGDGTHTVFCLYEETKDLTNRSRFVVADDVFKRCTEASEQGSSASQRD